MPEHLAKAMDAYRKDDDSWVFQCPDCHRRLITNMTGYLDNRYICDGYRVDVRKRADPDAQGAEADLIRAFAEHVNHLEEQREDLYEALEELLQAADDAHLLEPPPMSSYRLDRAWHQARDVADDAAKAIAQRELESSTPLGVFLAMNSSPKRASEKRGKADAGTK